MTTILLTRHGQTEWNREERFRGQIDVPLNETGERQAQALALRLKGWPVTALYTGPLQRARRTGELCARALGLEPQVLPGLLDLDYGQWQGLTPAEVAARDPELYARWLDQPSSVRFPGGEGLVDLRDRAVAAVEEVAERHTGGTIVLVAHMGVNKALLCGLMGLSLDGYWVLRQDTCCLNVIRCHGPRRYEIVSLNDTCHMAGLA